MQPIKVNDHIYDPFFGSGLVTKVFAEHKIVHVEYKKGASLMYTPPSTDKICKTSRGWRVPDSALGNNKVEGHVEIFEYSYKTNKVVNLTKPFYTTPAGRLRFSYWHVVRNGLNKASLNTVHCSSNSTLLYVLQNDPNKERYKALFWRTIARQLMKKAN
jgi:hypothetical protein